MSDDTLEIPDLTRVRKRKGLVQEDLEVSKCISAMLSESNVSCKVPEHIQHTNPFWKECYLSYFDVSDAIYRRDFLGLILDSDGFRKEFEDIYWSMLCSTAIEESLTRPGYRSSASDHREALNIRNLLALPRTLARIRELAGKSEALVSLKMFAQAGLEMLSGFAAKFNEVNLDEIAVRDDYTRFNHVKAELFRKQLLPYNHLLEQIVPIKAELEHYYLLSIPYTLKTIAGRRVPYCRPEFIEPEKREGTIIGAHNPLYSGVAKYPYLCSQFAVPNDVHWGDDARHSFVQGPNSQGKSVYISTVGLNVHLPMAGLYPFADSCALSPVGKILACIDTGDTDDKGHFDAGATKIDYMLENVCFSDMILMDEHGQGSEPPAERDIAKGISDALIAHGLTFFGVTHDRGAWTGYVGRPGIRMLRVADYDDAERKYKVWEGVAEGGYAMRRAKQIGVDPSSAMERLDKRLGRPG